MVTRARLLSPAQVVQRWGGAVSAKTLKNWRSQGTGPAYHRLGRAVVYSTADLEAWEREHLPEVQIADSRVPADGVLVVTSSGEAVFWCPACRDHHGVPLTRWKLTYGARGPSLRPSVLTYARSFARPRCHLILTEGELLYCSDCEHPLAGERVPMETLE